MKTNTPSAVEALRSTVTGIIRDHVGGRPSQIFAASDAITTAAIAALEQGEGEKANHAPKDWPQTPGAWKDQSRSRLDRVRAHRVEFNSDLRTAVHAVDDEAQRIHERNLTMSNADLIEQAFEHPPISSPTPSAGGVGWKLVPAKHDGRAGLTHEMCDAFWRAYEDADQHHGHFESTNAGYNAMLEAAPSPPAQPEAMPGREEIARLIAEDDVRGWSWDEETSTPEDFEKSVAEQAPFYLKVADAILALLSAKGE